MKKRRLILLAVLAFAGLHPHTDAQIAIDLGVAESFGVLGSSTVTSIGSTLVNGDLGVSPGAAISGFPPGTVTGTIHAANSTADEARADAILAYNSLAGETFDSNLTGNVMGGNTLTPGVYRFDSTAQLTGVLTLDGQGDPNARFHFQIGTTLTTASDSSVSLLNGALPENVFWQVGTSATLGTGTEFFGSILASQSITLNTLADISGRALALNGAVTMDGNSITVPVPVPEPLGASMLFGGFLVLFLGLRRARRRVPGQIRDLSGRGQQLL